MLRLIVDGRECPVECGESVALGYEVSSLADVESGRLAERVALTVPVTAETALIFGNGDDPLTAERFNREVHRAEVLADGVVLFCGTALLTGAVCRDREAQYKVEIKGDTALWARSAALRKVADASVKFSGTLVPEDICRGWSDDRPVKFFPVNRTEHKITNSSVSLLPADKVMTTDDYWPFLSVEAVVKALFADAGYTVESEFMNGELFRSLYFSGGYAVHDATERRQKMNFLAGRTTDATAAADYYGRVNMSASMKLNTVGNIVDTVSAYVTDSTGTNIPTGFFSNNDCFYVDDKTGIACFSPAVSASVGFEYSIAYITDHIITSRTKLTGFDRLYLGDDVYVSYSLVNDYPDQRGKAVPGYTYKLMIFDWQAGCTYSLKAVVDGVTMTVADTTRRMTAVTLPKGSSITQMSLLRAEKGSNIFNSCNDDWALYWGFVEETGRTEVEVKVRTSAVEMSSSSVKYFDKIFIEGALQGMNFTLLKRTTVRPVFSDSAGYGSKLSYSDVAVTDIRQTDLLAALGQMFDLRFVTDEPSKRVFIEPSSEFFSGGITDWSDRIDLDDPIVLEDPSSAVHESITFGYGEDDKAVTRYNNRENTRLGRWRFECGSKAALDGDQMRINPVFSPTVNTDDNYYEARSASIMQVRDAEDADDETLSGNFSTRIVRYAGLRPLASGEVWNPPFDRAEYPLAAFHFAGDSRTAGFTLCFEDRDDLKGLNVFHRRHLAEESEGAVLTLSLHLHPEEVAALRQCRKDAPSVRSRFRLDIGGRTSGALYTLRSIKGYDPSKSTVRCSFTKIPATLCSPIAKNS